MTGITDGEAREVPDARTRAFLAQQFGWTVRQVMALPARDCVFLAGVADLIRESRHPRLRWRRARRARGTYLIHLLSWWLRKPLPDRHDRHR